jgi:hypothetical protein
MEVTMRAHRATATAIGLSLALAFSGAAFAADNSMSTTSGSSGTTSGPAAGGNVQPGMQGQNMSHNKQKSNSVGGAPGVQGAKGSKAGPSSK